MSPRVVLLLPVMLRGGTEYQTLALARVLVAADYRVVVCGYYEHDREMADAFREAGCEVSLLGMRRSQGLPRLFGRLRRLLGAWQPAVAHVQYAAPGLVPVLAARAAGVTRVFATVHQPGGRFGWQEKSLLRVASRLCTAFCCVSQAVEASWFGDSALFDPARGRAGRRHFTLYNAVDTNAIRPAEDGDARERLKESLGLAGKRVVGVVGRLRGEKGQAELVALMPSVIAAVGDAVLVIVGDGPDREGLRALAERSGVGERVLGVGWRSHAETCALYAAMDVVAVPSAFEGFSLAAAEAMAAGIPVVARDVDGLREVVVDGETGYLVSAARGEGFVAPLVRVLKNPRLAEALGRAGRERVERLFSLEQYRASVCAFYRDAGAVSTGAGA